MLSAGGATVRAIIHRKMKRARVSEGSKSMSVQALDGGRFIIYNVQSEMARRGGKKESVVQEAGSKGIG